VRYYGCYRNTAKYDQNKNHHKNAALKEKAAYFFSHKNSSRNKRYTKATTIINNSPLSPYVEQSLGIVAKNIFLILI
jgi:hypothetical protein